MRAAIVMVLLVSSASAAPTAKPAPPTRPGPAAKPDPEPPRPKPSLEVVAPAGIPAAALPAIEDKWWKGKQPCPAGSKLTKTARKQLTREVFCAKGSTKQGPYAKLVVADDDAGVDVEALERVEYLAEQGHHVDGVRQGLWTTGFRGTESSRVYYLNGKREGVERTVQDGFRDELMENYAIELKTYQHDVLDGPLERLDDDGQVTRVRFFKRGKKDGRWLVFKHGRRIEEENWDDGVAHGRFARWDDDGHLVRSSDLVHGTGTITEWMWDGTESSETAYVNGIEHGPFKRWLAGQPAEEGTHAHGEIDGRNLEWDNGVKTESVYVAGHRNGPYKKWRDDKLVEEGSYLGGEQDGVVTTYRDDGSKEWQGHYRGGSRDGEWIHWTRSGRENARGRFSKGRHEGLWLVGGAKLRYQKGKLQAVNGGKPPADPAEVETPADD